jgi:hypothetical protein
MFDHDAAALRLVRRGLNAKRVGRLLRRAEGQAVDGYVVQREGFELHAVLWCAAQLTFQRERDPNEGFFNLSATDIYARRSLVVK